jgi:hypothetical protein
MLQTWWDVNQQIVRKAIDGIAGAVAGWLIAQGEWGALLAPAVAIGVNFGWFWISNRNWLNLYNTHFYLLKIRTC